MSGHILVVEDDPDVGMAIRSLLLRAGFEVEVAPTGREGLRAFHQRPPALVVLDLGLPDLDGLVVLDRLRELSNRPVLILTAQGSEGDKVRGLRAGADDYLIKPFSNAELLARVEAAIRRYHLPPDAGSGPAALLTGGGVVVDESRHEATDGGVPLQLTALEFRLLVELLRARGGALSTEQLLRTVWRDETRVGPERVKFTVLRLRRKLRDPDAIASVRGIGYRFSG
ncbi:response regulator transcription factor [Amnibacterium kyonggiense]